jgi:hypothetical protein
MLIIILQIFFTSIWFQTGVTTTSRVFVYRPPHRICHLWLWGGPAVSNACLSLCISLACPRSPPLPRMDCSRYTRGQSVGCGSHFIFLLPYKHNNVLLSHQSPNKCSSSCIFNILTDAIILYTPCSLILMPLLLFIARHYFSLAPLISIERLLACWSVCWHSKAIGPMRAADSRVNECRRRAREGDKGSKSICDLLYPFSSDVWCQVSVIHNSDEHVMMLFSISQFIWML